MSHCLSVDGAHLREACRTFAKRLRRMKSHERAILGFDGRCLTIEARDTLAFAQAVGSWPGTAHVPASLVAALAAAPPPGERLTVLCDETTVKFGSVKVDCYWQPISRAIQSALPAKDWLRGIALRFQNTRGELVQKGLVAEVADAERKLLALVKRTAKALAPLGVTVDDLRELVERRLEERYCSESRPS